MNILAILLIAIGIPSWAQTAATGSARSTGSCNSAISGSQNHVVVTCTGVSSEKANELVRVMNEILAREIDLKKVYSQLEQIHSEVSSLTNAVNPLAKASPAANALIQESQQMEISCSNSLRAVEAKRTDARLAAVKDSPIGSQPQPAPVNVHQQMMDAVDKEYLRKYQKEVAPELYRWRTQFLKQVPNISFTEDWSDAQTINQVAFVCGDFGKLRQRYQSTGSVDAQIMDDLNAEDRKCNSFREAWSRASSDANTEFYRHHQTTTPVQSAALPRILSVPDSINPEQLAEYKKSLAPKLVAWRTRVLANLPDTTSARDYVSISTIGEFAQVCTDVMALASTYTAKVLRDVQNGNSSSAGSNRRPLQPTSH